MKKTILLFMGLCWTHIGISDPSTLTLAQALITTRKNAPELRAAQMQVQAAEHAINAADYWSSPVLEVEVEGIGNGAVEYTLELNKTFRRGDKSSKERAVAQQAVRIVEEAESEAALAFIARVSSTFYEALAQQEIALVRAEQEVLAREFVEDATKRFNAGAASELDVLQADLALEKVLIEKQHCIGDLDSAKRALAALMAVSIAELGTLTGNFYELPAPTSSVVSDQHPALRRLQEQEALLKAASMLAVSQDASDVVLGAGVRYNAAFSEPSYVLGLSMPLALSGRGRAEGASHNLKAEAIHSENEQLRRDLQLKLSAFNTIYQRAVIESKRYRADLLPKVEKIYSLSRAGYEAGRYSWLELIVAQQQRSELRIRYIEVLSVAHQARVEMGKYRGKELGK